MFFWGVLIFRLVLLGLACSVFVWRFDFSVGFVRPVVFGFRGVCRFIFRLERFVFRFSADILFSSVVLILLASVMSKMFCDFFASFVS